MMASSSTRTVVGLVRKATSKATSPIRRAPRRRSTPWGRCRRPDRIGAADPLGREPARPVDSGQAQLVLARVREAVRLARRADDDVAARYLERLRPDPEGRRAGLDDEHLGVRVPVHLRPVTGLDMDEDEGEGRVLVVRADELVRVL